MHARSISSFAGLSALFALATFAQACSAPASNDADTSTEDVKRTASTAQMNDVSILLPLAKTKSELGDYLGPASKTAGGDLVPADLLGPVIDATRGIMGGIDPTTLKAVAYRFDPCFAQIGPITDPSTCDHQIRVVFQNLTATTSGVTAQDDGVHVFYSLDADTWNAALKEVIALRNANGNTTTDLGALDVHPIVAKQGLGGAMNKGLASIVLKYAAKASLTRITAFLGVFAQHTSWNFAVTDVKDGKATTSAIAGLADDALSESIGLGTAPTDLVQLSFPPTTTSDDVSPLLRGTVQDDADAHRQAAFDAALRIENPGFHSPNTIDCVSCHTAEIARQLVGEDFFKLTTTGDANAFAQDPKYVTKTDMKVKYPALQPNGLAVNLHAFSYDGTKPMIIGRVINETAAIVALVNSGALTSGAK